MPDVSYLAWPFFDQGHRDQARELERWTAEALPRLLEGAEGDLDAVYACVGRLVRELGAAGLLRSCVPAVYGGVREQLDVRSLCLAREILARGSGLADFAFAMQGLGSVPITLFGTEDQKRSILPRVAAGALIGAFALSEPDAGSDVGAIATRAGRDRDSWRLDGTKTWISNAGLAHYYVVFARTGEESGTKALSAFIVDADTPGLDASERIDVIAPHPLGTLRFTDCRVPADRLLGQPGEGFRIAMGTLDVFRSTVGAAALGFARRAFDEAAQRALERRLFGRALSEFQLTQAKLADMAIAVDAAALLVYRAGWTRDVVGGRITREASIAKLFATESAQQVVDAAVQIFGGLGVVRGMTVERLYREVRALRIYEGASEVLKLIVASRVLETMAAQAAPTAAPARPKPAPQRTRPPGKKKS
jgi:acyl-CoA dehydrogenase